MTAPPSRPPSLPLSPPGPLKLRARDADDLAVISACLQDAVVPVKDMTYLAGENRFALVANRFRWEQAGGAPVEGRIYERVHAGVCFDGVASVRQSGLDQMRRSQILSLLALTGGDGFIELAFSAGVAIRLEVSKIMCHLEDLDEPWPTQWRPAHRLDDGD